MNMKRNNEFVKVSVSGIEYDLEDMIEGGDYPKRMSVQINKDMLDCCVDSNGEFDEEEAVEMIADEIESKTGACVLNLKPKFN